MSLIETTKIAYELAKKAANIELQEKLMDMREQALELQEENIALKRQIKELEERLDVREKIVWDKEYQVYWLEQTGGEERDGPYCQHCWDADTRLIRIQRVHAVTAGRSIKRWRCPACNNFFGEGP